MMSNLSWKGWLDVSASVAMLAVAAVVLSDSRLFRPATPRSRTAFALPKTPLPLNGLATKGDLRAPVALILYSDFQCPFCRRLAIETLPSLEKDLVVPGILLIAYKHLPLETIHAQALSAAVLAECSYRVGQFWRVHDALFSIVTMTPEALEAVANREGVPADSPCRTSDAIDVIRRQQEEAKDLGISGTPALLLGTIGEDGRLIAKTGLSGFQSAKAIAAEVSRLAKGAR